MRRIAWTTRPTLATHLFALGALGLASPAAEAADPDRVWGTYLPGNWAPQVAVDGSGNLYIAVNTWFEGFATPGAHKEQPDGDDVLLMKLDPAGDRIWGTYFGGGGIDRALAISIHGDDLVLGGTTTSSAGIASPGAFKSIKETDSAGYVATFTTDGAWLCGTYVEGATGLSEVRGVHIGPDGTVDATGMVTGEAGIATPGAHRTTPAGKKDGFVIHLGLEGELLWGSYYGGLENEDAEDVTRDAVGGVYVVGSARSSDGIASIDAHQVVYAGNADIFLARFTEGGALDWGTYLGGASADHGWRVAAHPNGGIALIGDASSQGLATPGTHQQTVASSDMLLARFDAAGTRLWSTYYGGENSDIGWAIAVDPTGSIYIGGYAYSLAQIATPNAFKSAKTGNRDGVLARFDDTGALQWGTYYGGELEDWIRSLATRGDGRILVGGRTMSDTGIATPDGMLPSRDGNPSFAALFDTNPAVACVAPRDCASGHCVDGVCCDVACGGGVDDCQACSQAAGAAIDGHCGPSAPGVSCRGSAGVCDAEELCTANSRHCPPDADYPDGTECPDGVCLAGVCGPLPDATTGGDMTEGTGTTAATTSTTGATTGAETLSETTIDPDTTTTTGPLDTTGSVDPTLTGTSGPVTSDASTSGPIDDGTSGPAAPTSSGPDVPPTTTSNPSTSDDPTTGEATGETTGDGCGCATRPAAPHVLLVPGALLVIRRRRR